MIFKEGEIDSSDDMAVQAWHSENSQWVIQVSRKFFGYQIHFIELRFGWQHAGVSHMYCAAADKDWLEAILTVSMKALEKVPETINGDGLRNYLPYEHRKPMKNDPACWHALCKLAGVDFTLPPDELAEVVVDRQRLMQVQITLILRFAQDSPAAEAGSETPVPATHS